MTTPDDRGDVGTYDHPDHLRGHRAAAGTPHFPAALMEKYPFVGEIRSQGSEAYLVRVRRAREGDEAVLKVYGEPLEDRVDVLRRIQGREFAHIAQLYDLGSVDGIGYEVLEWIPGGTLDQFVESHGGTLDDRTGEQVVRELAHALRAFHELVAPAELAHGDVKPDNILVRTKAPLDLVLADFGRATKRTQQLGYPHPAPWWTCPGDASTTPEGDWWSLGCIVYWFLTGHEPFHELEKTEVVSRKTSGDPFPVTDLPAGRDLDWTTLVKGLTTLDQRDRWSYDEVSAWLDGVTPPLGDEWAVAAPVVVHVPEPAPVAPIRFADGEYHSLPELAVALSREWPRAAALVSTDEGRNSLKQVLTDFAASTHDLDLVHEAGEILGSRFGPERLLASLITALDPDLPPSFRLADVTRHGLAALADEAAGNPGGRAGDALEALLEGDVLPGYAAPGRDVDYVAVSRRWRDELATWDSVVRHHSVTPDSSSRRLARARVLSGVLNPSAASRMAHLARRDAGRAGRSAEWFRELTAEPAQPGASVAALQLAAAARLQADDARVARRAARSERARERAGRSALRYPRTRRCLTAVLPVLVVLSCAAVVLHVLPRQGASLFVTPAEWLRFWVRIVPTGLQSWLAGATLPWLTIPATMAALMTWARAPRVSGPVAPVRHPLERRAIQGLIAYTAVLVPLLVPFTAYGWASGLRLQASDELYPPRAVRTISFVVGAIGVTGGLLALWQLPAPRAPRWFDVSYAWDYKLVQTIQEDWPTGILAPWSRAVSSAVGADGSAFLSGTIVMLLASSALLALAGLDYVVRRGWTTGAMVVLLIPGTVAAAVTLLAYGMVGQSLAVDAVWVVVLVFFVRHRIRNRGRPRPERG